MRLAAGNRLGPYAILAAAGAGGMGEIDRARDTRLGHIVAIKVLPVGSGGDAALRSRQQREARAISSLNHPIFAELKQNADLRVLPVAPASGEPLGPPRGVVARRPADRLQLGPRRIEK